MLHLVRHCSASGQEPEASLTPAGERQAEQLAGRLADELRAVDRVRIVSSPYARAVATIRPLAERLGVAVETDDRLRERALCAAPIADWRDRLRASFDDLDLCLEGGESSRAALARGLAALADARAHGGLTVVVTHGNMLALLLREIDGRDGFAAWASLTTPDLYRVDGSSVERLA